MAERDAQHDFYQAVEWYGTEWKGVLYVPGEGVDLNPPEVVIG